MKNLNHILGYIPGFLSQREAELLYKIAHDKAGNIIEIGSLHGRSTVVLAEAIKDSDKSGKVFAIDPGYMDIQSLVNFQKNISHFGVDKYIQPITISSEEANKNWHDPVDFLWIDGDHTYKGAELDFLLWEPYLKIGGIIAYHDVTFNHPDVRKVVAKYIFRSRKFKKVGFVDGIAFATKCKRNSLWDLVQSLYVLFIKNLVTSSLYIKPPRVAKELIKPIVRKISRSSY